MEIDFRSQINITKVVFSCRLLMTDETAFHSYRLFSRESAFLRFLGKQTATTKEDH